jgi:hypothetical protein
MDRLLTPRRAIVAAGVVGFLAALLTAIVCGIPVPQVHDEFSYLLAADTYAHGRLTNPTHPLWPWFETFHVLQRPTYMSRYPPGQGAFLALGQLAGLPIAGAWLSAAFACAAVVWMLVVWLPPRWALAGGVLLATHPLMMAWSHSYWGGGVAVLGGALTISGAVRLARSSSASDSLLLGAGMVVLAYSRPWEGGVLAILLLVVGGAMRLIPWKGLWPAAIVLALGLAFLAYDNWRVTGHPLLLPHVLYGRQYGTTPPLIWQGTHHVVYRHRVMEQISTEWDLDLYRQRRSPAGLLMLVPDTLSVYAAGAFAFVPDRLLVRVMNPTTGIVLSVIGLVQELLLAAPLFFAAAALRRDRLLGAVAIVACGVFLVALVPSMFPLTHYGAPLAPALLLFWLAGLRELMARRWNARGWSAIVAGMWLFGIVFFLVENRRHPYRSDEVPQRLEIARRLAAQPGRQLVIVRYLPSHNPHAEWVENSAEIDAQSTVWAHDMPDNAPLLRYYRDRNAWLLTVGDRAPVLEPYERSPAPALRPHATPAPAAGG